MFCYVRAQVLSEAEIAALYERYGFALYKRCLRLICNEADARELLQETFLQFVEGQARFAGRSSPFTYLYRIATNLSIDRLRRKITAGEPVELDEQSPAPGGGEAPQRRAAVLEELAMLTHGLDQEVLTIAVMAYVDGLTQEEIAVSLSLSRKTIGKRLGQFLSFTRGQIGGDAGAALLALERSHGRFGGKSNGR